MSNRSPTSKVTNKLCGTPLVRGFRVGEEAVSVAPRSRLNAPARILQVGEEDVLQRLGAVIFSSDHMSSEPKSALLYDLARWSQFHPLVNVFVRHFVGEMNPEGGSKQSRVRNVQATFQRSFDCPRLHVVEQHSLGDGLEKSPSQAVRE